jgi:hypothetical protein
MLSVDGENINLARGDNTPTAFSCTDHMKYCIRKMGANSYIDGRTSPAIHYTRELIFVAFTAVTFVHHRPTDTCFAFGLARAVEPWGDQLKYMLSCPRYLLLILYLVLVSFICEIYSVSVNLTKSCRNASSIFAMPVRLYGSLGFTSENAGLSLTKNLRVFR